MLGTRPFPNVIGSRRSGAGGELVPFYELNSNGSTIKWTNGGASSYEVNVYGASDLSGGVLATVTTSNTQVAMSAFGLPKSNDYWVTVTGILGADELIWEDDGLRFSFGTEFTDCVAWASAAQCLYSVNNKFIVPGSGVVTGISPPIGYVIITGGTGWTTGNYSLNGRAINYIGGNTTMVYVGGNVSDGPLYPAAAGTGGGIGYWQPYITPTKQFVTDGNSLVAGYQTGTTINVRSLVGAGRKWKNSGNFGVNSQTTTNMIADAVAQIDSLFDSGLQRNVVIPWEITNELFAGTSVATAMANFKSYCSARKAAGWYVMPITVLPRSTSSGLFTEGNRILCNAELLAPENIGVYWDDVIDLTSDSRFEDKSNTTYFNADQIHLTELAYTLVGDKIGAKLSLL
jgi:hypothetical protein